MTPPAWAIVGAALASVGACLVAITLAVLTDEPWVAHVLPERWR